MLTAPFTPDDRTRLREALTDVIADGPVPGGVVAYGTADTPATFVGLGQVAPEYGDHTPGPHTRYDIASLTKVVATWPLVGRAVDAGLMELDTPVRHFLPPVHGDTPSGEATARQLLTHTSGLRASTRLDHYRGTERPLHELLLCEPLETTAGPHRYINRGFVLLGLALAHVHRQPLDQLAAHLWDTLDMKATVYGPLTRAADVAPTEQRFPGAPRIWGSAHDDNAALLGGVAGHAGVFSTAADLATYAQRLLIAHREPGASPLGAWLNASLVPHAAIEAGLDRGLSWVLAAGGQVAYHHGFTGTSLYLAPRTGRYLVILTNAVHNGPTARLRVAPLRSLALKTVSTT